MNGRGFMPFSAAGTLIVIIALMIAAQTAFSRHQRSLATIDDISGSSLLMVAESVHGDLRFVAVHAVCRALWEVGKEASNYDDASRKLEIESLATRYFVERVSELAPEYSRHDARIEVRILGGANWSSLKISDDGSGYVSARAGLPDESRIKLTSWDGRTSLAIPFENIDVFIDSRYFLLEQSMDKFVDKRGEIVNSWQIMEYSQAWAGAWLSGKVELNELRTKAFFETAWSMHELSIFGSSDYLAAAQLLTNADGGGTKNQFGETNDRESFYELLPPAPIRQSPGISVYRELDLKSVSYERMDPAGLLGSPTATPIPIPTTGVVIWWGQWKITVELEATPIEEIFDFDNPTIPLVHGNFYVHKPLAYRWEMPEKKFITIVAVFSLKPFTIHSH
ncbi:MAG: hypothetical protein ABH852_04195 [Methanobacteriota archaeon]